MAQVRTWNRSEAWDEALHDFLDKKANATETVKIGRGQICGASGCLQTIDESLLQAAIYNNRKLDLHLFHSEKVDDTNAESPWKTWTASSSLLDSAKEVSKGKFRRIEICSSHDIPTLGICLGMQCMVVGSSYVMCWASKEANSTEMDEHAFIRWSTWWKNRRISPTWAETMCLSVRVWLCPSEDSKAYAFLFFSMETITAIVIAMNSTMNIGIQFEKLAWNVWAWIRTWDLSRW